MSHNAAQLALVLECRCGERLEAVWPREPAKFEVVMKLAPTPAAARRLVLFVNFCRKCNRKIELIHSDNAISLSVERNPKP